MADGEAGGEAGGERLFLRRSGEDRGPSLVERIGDRLAEAGFRSPLHRMRLKGRFPLKLLAVPVDPVPGDPDRGARLAAGRLFHSGYGVPLSSGALDSPDAPAPWRRWLHGWGWLRDAAARPPEGVVEAERIERLARRWLERFPDYDAEAWAPDVTGRRVLMAIAHAPLLMPRHDHVHRSAVLNGIARWTRHLEQAVRRLPDGLLRLEAVAGLLGGALLLPGQDERQARAEAMLAPLLSALLDDEGVAALRGPLELGAAGDLLLLLAAFYAARGLNEGAAVAGGLEAVRRRLGALAMGGGQVSPWHGGAPSPAQLARLGVRPCGGPVLSGGFVRLEAGATVVVMDAGPPPAARQALAPHASTLAIAVADGGAPLLVSCGGAFATAPDGIAALALPHALAEGLRATAAHSALVLADTNSTPLAGSGARRRGGVEEVAIERRSGAEGQLVEAVHDGYRGRFGFLHRRRLWLAADGADLRGEDVLLPAPGLRRIGAGEPLPLAIRFHLAPGTVVSLTGAGDGALVRLAGARPREAAAWALRCRLPEGFHLRIEPSIAVDWQGEVRPTNQLVIAGSVTRVHLPAIPWAFRRQSRGSAHG